MKKRYPIRGTGSDNEKIRLMDIVVEDDGEMKIEVKGTKGKRSITLKEFEDQIKKMTLEK